MIFYVCPDCGFERDSKNYRLTTMTRIVCCRKEYKQFKQCGRCGEIYGPGNFYSNASSNDGYSAYCRDCSKESIRSYLETDKGRAASQRANHRRRALENAACGDYTADEFDALCHEYNHRCAACGQKRPLTVDHVVPLSKGGANSIDNIQPLCKPCNSQKHTKTIDYRS